eukprot:TRINITY_DN19325_c0_g1_i1.p1 TRINITY_DN19325_c0_g1~~TRINITY_DN19325_c0_g1_i1.p1  ORF type:complete len:226 (-),score=33.49 TRINITY_DN19325_c0_g1_i1:156-833(-)
MAELQTLAGIDVWKERNIVEQDYAFKVRPPQYDRDTGLLFAMRPGAAYPFQRPRLPSKGAADGAVSLKGAWPRPRSAGELTRVATFSKWMLVGRDWKLVTLPLPASESASEAQRQSASAEEAAAVAGREDRRLGRQSSAVRQRRQRSAATARPNSAASAASPAAVEARGKARGPRASSAGACRRPPSSCSSAACALPAGRSHVAVGDWRTLPPFAAPRPELVCAW